MQFQRSVNSEQINQRTQHKLFVEGKDNQQIDPIVIQELLRANDLGVIEVLTMGSCDNVYNAAQALVHQHSSYYFLIDRDERDQIIVDNSWRNFPNLNTHNILIWHKRELENYFIDPEYICKSSYLKSNIDIQQKILDECNRRLFIDAANLTLYKLKSELRDVSITKPIFKYFGEVNLFKKEQDGLLELENRLLILNSTLLTKPLRQNNIAQIYANFLEELSGGQFPLKYNSGNWLQRMSGKEIFSILSNEYFEVKDASNKLLSGKEKNKQIAKQLVKLHIQEQPQDFQNLVNILKERIRQIP